MKTSQYETIIYVKVNFPNWVYSVIQCEQQKFFKKLILKIIENLRWLVLYYAVTA